MTNLKMKIIQRWKVYGNKIPTIAKMYEVSEREVRNIIFESIEDEEIELIDNKQNGRSNYIDSICDEWAKQRQLSGNSCLCKATILK